MLRCSLLLLLAPAAMLAETHVLTLRQALERAEGQNPDALVARLNEQIAAENVKIARGPFLPRVVVGSGLAYTSGFPMSIEGSAPSIIQARAIQSIYNRPLSFQVAAAKETARGASIDAFAARDEAAYRVASLFLDAERLERAAGLAEKQLEALEKVARVIEARVGEGKELPIENKRALLSENQAKQRAGALRADERYAQASLAILLGYPADDRVQPAGEERNWPDLSESESELVEQALSSSKELRKLETALRAKALEVQAVNSARYPQVDLVAQYGLFAKFNNYDEFFNHFQRNNGEVGVSIAFPILPGRASSGEKARAQFEMARLRTEFNATRDRLAVNARQNVQEVRRAQEARDVARLDLEVARDQLSILLAQMQEGRVTLRQVEEARSAEMLRWMALYDAESAIDRARLQILRQSGSLLAAWK